MLSLHLEYAPYEPLAHAAVEYEACTDMECGRHGAIEWYGASHVYVIQ